MMRPSSWPLFFFVAELAMLFRSTKSTFWQSLLLLKGK